MPFKLNGVIDTDTGERVTILRKIAGDYDDGIWVDGREVSIKALASVQQPSKQEIELFTGLERTKDMKTFYVNKTIQASNEFNDTEADRIKWKGRIYKTMHLGEWGSFGYSVVLGVRIS